MARLATTADAFNAIADPHRRVLLDVLLHGEATVSELTERTDLSQPQASKHLGVLRDVGLVRVRADGRRRWYRIDPAGLELVHRWTGSFHALWNARLDLLDNVVGELAAHDDTGRDNQEELR